MIANRVRWALIAALAVLLCGAFSVPALAQATPAASPGATPQATVAATIVPAAAPTAGATPETTILEQGAGDAGTAAGAERAAPCGAKVTVQRGDTLSQIARRCGTTVAAILKANPIVKNPSRIFPGMVLVMPGGGTQPQPGGQTVYTVQRGDTLNAIARRFGVTVAAILKANPAIRDPSRIYVGQRIVIPAGGTQPQPTPPPPGGSTSTKIYLISLNDGTIGCGDGAVPVTVQIEPTRAVLHATIQALLSQKSQYYGESGLYNALYQSSLSINSVNIVDGEARIALEGQVVLGGTCDAPRVQAQLEQTARQFSTVKSVAITVNGQPLAEVLSSK
jgi:LysM repeat protein